jgi:hypothetical protein
MRPRWKTWLWLQAPQGRLAMWGAFPREMIEARGNCDVSLRYSCSFDLIQRARIRKPHGPGFILSTAQLDKLLGVKMLDGHRIALEEDLAQAKLLPLAERVEEASRQLPLGWKWKGLADADAR